MSRNKKTSSKKSFTLAEMLITLTVVSVVAIMTLPSLFYKIDEFQWNSARQKMVYNIREAARRLSTQNAGLSGLGTAANFRDELSKYLAVTKSCDTVTDCFPATIKNIVGNAVTTPASGTDLDIYFATTPTPGAATGLILNNGASLNIIYNTDCTSSSSGADHLCVNIIFDINGFNSPNQVGKDIGFASVITVFNITTESVNPDTIDSADANWSNAQTNCRAKGEGWYLPTLYELSSIYFNKKIIGNISPSFYWSSREDGPTYADGIVFTSGAFSGSWLAATKPTTAKVRCIRR